MINIIIVCINYISFLLKEIIKLLFLSLLNHYTIQIALVFIIFYYIIKLFFPSIYYDIRRPFIMNIYNRMNID